MGSSSSTVKEIKDHEPIGYDEKLETEEEVTNDLVSFMDHAKVNKTSIGQLHNRMERNPDGEAGSAHDPRRFAFDLKGFLNFFMVHRTPTTVKAFELFARHREEVDMREVLAALRALIYDTLENKVKFAFALFDTRGQGVLTLKTLEQVVRSLHYDLASDRTMKKAEVILRRASSSPNEKTNIALPELLSVVRKTPDVLFPSFVIDRCTSDFSETPDTVEDERDFKR
mmetsp:Transcript_43645/g.113759  ORF Transcript_43645/g.113759 Transcript_43645/m.113759 type:complete len:227 (+) Transcript_43645:736-1416(+)|eukprot:CAMPEP_0113890880 /NCGR_PEP_ID=MMETSP0780_2-20120614/14418_1 /TAXON_ID=652834 /ORGANISM="Palpitomonas bilix" /LENGTH=226 /DNA_ID=CAMNT_0000880379 /DNA_START=705 /DNA_END=1385 /DNA_ORIENTATION=- /assembly_acc=CAM_ASM_000599